MESDSIQKLWERRDRLHILKEIMEAAKGGQLKTRIMYMVNLSYSQVNEYLSFLAEMGFLSINERKGKTFYETSAKGEHYIENYQELLSLLNPEDSVDESPVLIH